jgi:hypothetical protein
MKGFSHKIDWEFLAFVISLSQNRCNKCLCSKQIDDEVPLKIWANEDWICGDFPFDITEIFLCIYCPFKPLVLFQQ